MTSVYAATAPKWLEMIATLPKSQAAAFWQPTPAHPRKISKGERWYFKELGRPLISGFGNFVKWESLTISSLFDHYGLSSGYVSAEELLGAMREFKKDAASGSIVGNVVLEDIVIFPRPLRLDEVGLSDLSVKFVYLPEDDPVTKYYPISDVADDIIFDAPTQDGSGLIPTKGVTPSEWSKQVEHDASKSANIYALRFGDYELWKVGWAVDVKKRLKLINDHIPDEVISDKWACVYAQHLPSKRAAFDAEQEILKRLTAYRTKGERVACSKKDFETVWFDVIARIRV